MNNPKKEPFSALIAPGNNSGKMTDICQPDGEAGDATVDMGYITFFPRQPQSEHDENSGAFSPQPDHENNPKFDEDDFRTQPTP